MIRDEIILPDRGRVRRFDEGFAVSTRTRKGPNPSLGGRGVCTPQTCVLFVQAIIIIRYYRYLICIIVEKKLAKNIVPVRLTLLSMILSRPRARQNPTRFLYSPPL